MSSNGGDNGNRNGFDAKLARYLAFGALVAAIAVQLGTLTSETRRGQDDIRSALTDIVSMRLETERKDQRLALVEERQRQTDDRFNLLMRRLSDLEGMLQATKKK